MKRTKVTYTDGILTIEYPKHTKVCRDIHSTRIALKRIINYRIKSESQKKSLYYAALADLIRRGLDQMIIDNEIKHFGDVFSETHANC